jgi:mannose-6-phosphate isomerase-like protein (cupin superfamily)
MHIVRTFDESALTTPLGYSGGHSEGYGRASLIDQMVAGCVHTGIGICQLEPDGLLAPHVHSYEEAFYILEGEVLAGIDGRHYRFGPGDYGIIPMGQLHAWRNVGSTRVRWHETVSPQPRPAGHPEPDTFFMPGSAPTDGEPPDLADPLTRCLGHFDLSLLPPPSQLQMDGYRGDSVQGISLKMMVDRLLGAQHLTTFMVQFQPDGAGNVHDHPLEETYFFLSGEAKGILDGQTYQVKAGDFVWTSVGGTHGFFNTGSEPVRWLETQAPQPPAQQAFRFNAHWQYLAEKLKK